MVVARALSCCWLLSCVPTAFTLLAAPPSTVAEASQLLLRWQRDQAPSQVHTLASGLGDERCAVIADQEPVFVVDAQLTRRC